MLVQTRLLIIKEVTGTLRQSERTVREKVADGTLQAIRIGSGPKSSAPHRRRRAQPLPWKGEPMIQGKKGMARKDLERILAEDSSYEGIRSQLSELTT